MISHPSICHFHCDKICIIGVGLIGGSFAAGLKQANQVQTIVGFGRHEDSLIKAKSLGIIDEYSLDIATALQNVDMVLIATPVDSFGAVLGLIKPHVTDAVIISDVGSTKGSVIDIAKQVFGKVPTRFIPAHPIAGKEKSGVEASDGTLFDNKRVILTPEDNADVQAIEAVSELWQILGARVETMTHQKHDDLLAMTSHLPHMLAFGLMNYLVTNNPDACDYAAGGFKDFSRIASIACVSALSSGVRITRLLSNNAPSLASTPLFSLPAIGCAGINLVGTLPNTSFAISITLPLVLPTSEMITASVICGLISPKIAPKLSTGVAINTISTFCNAVAISKLYSSITPSDLALIKLSS